MKEATRLLILLEITAHRHGRMKSIADKIGLTVQGVSDYLKSMSSEGLVQHVSGVYTATMKGVDLLQERFKELREFVDRAYRDMRILDICSAIAREDIQEGERVGLFMEDAYLVAYPGRQSPSHGRSLHSARRGEDVTVVELEGILDLSMGRITVVRIPGAREGGTRAVDLTTAREFLEGQPKDRLAVSDAVAKALALKLGLEPDFEFAAASASFDAALRGLDVLLLASEDSSAEVVSTIETANEGMEEKVPYHLVALP